MTALIEIKLLREHARETEGCDLPEPYAREQKTDAKEEQADERDEHGGKHDRPRLPVGKATLMHTTERAQRIEDLSRVELAAVVRHVPGDSDHRTGQEDQAEGAEEPAFEPHAERHQRHAWGAVVGHSGEGYRAMPEQIFWVHPGGPSRQSAMHAMHDTDAVTHIHQPAEDGHCKPESAEHQVMLGGIVLQRKHPCIAQREWAAKGADCDGFVHGISQCMVRH